MGSPAPEHIPDDWIWAEFWTRYFTDREPRNSWVVCRTGDEQVIGYLTGTADIRRFDRYIPFLIPGIVLHAIRRRLLRRLASRRAIISMLRSLAAGEMSVPARVARDYPATMHVDLLPEARARGVAGRLYRLFVKRMRSLGATGIHAQTLSLNKAITRFCRNAGFTLAASRPIRAFDHVEAEPINIFTWTKPLRSPRKPSDICK